MPGGKELSRTETVLHYYNRQSAGKPGKIGLQCKRNLVCRATQMLAISPAIMGWTCIDCELHHYSSC